MNNAELQFRINRLRRLFIVMIGRMGVFKISEWILNKLLKVISGFRRG